MHMLPAAPSSPLLQPSTPAPDPACLEWYPTLSQQQCSHEVEVQQLGMQVGELRFEAEENIELRTELRQDYRRMSSEIREQRDLIKNLVDQRNWDDLRRQCDEKDRRGWENKIATHITFSEAKAIDHVSQLPLELREELLLRCSKLENLNQNQDPTQMDDLRHEPVVELDTPNTTPEAESTGQNKKSGGGLAESQHAPLRYPPGHCTPPPGPKAWREMMAMRKTRSKKSKAGRQQILPQRSKLDQLEAEISQLKEKISRKEKARVNNSNNNNDIRAERKVGQG
jgi:septal ring factor EnvC (AmiA/AmiB activator)